MSFIPLSGNGDVTGLTALGCTASSNVPPPHQQQLTSDTETKVTELGPADGNVVSRLAAIASPESEEPTAAVAHPADASNSRRGNSPHEPGPLNRVRQVREQQGVSIRSFAKRLGLDIRRTRELENPECDLRLSELFAIQRALDVPIADLLVENCALARPVAERAKMVKAMKTAVAIREASRGDRATRMATMLCEQLCDVMPELADVSGWPQFGARRGKSAISKALANPIDMSQLDRS